MIDGESRTPPLPGLTVVVPACNEAADIVRVVRGLLAVLPTVACRHEVIVVDDGSSDGTGAALAAVPGIRVLRHPENRGYGAALRTGLAAAREPWSFFTDGDGQFDPGDLPRLAAAAAAADLVVGYRVARADPLARRVCGRVWTWLVGVLLGVRVRDVNCAFKLVRGEVLAALTLESAGALVNAELLGKAIRRGFRVHEVAVSHRPRLHGRASGGRPRVIWRAFRELAALAGRIREPAAAGRPAPVRGAKHPTRVAVLGLLLAAAVVAGPARAVEVGRYRFSCRADVGTFVLDTESGRVWRYDRVDDAWYLYDLEALVGKSARARKSEHPGPEPDDPPSDR